MSIDQLESFVAVAEEGAVVRAAARLHISQPPLSRRIQGLEAELGTPLFERQARGMALTPAGQQLLPHARGILAALDDARQAVLDGPGTELSRTTPADSPRRSPRRSG